MIKRNQTDIQNKQQSIVKLMLSVLIKKVKVVPSSLSEGWVIGADPDSSAIQPCGGQVQSNG